MANPFSEAYHHLLQEDMDFLLERSNEHERNLSEIFSRWDNLLNAIAERDVQLHQIQSERDRLAQTLERQGDQIKRFNGSMRRLEFLLERSTEHDRQLSEMAKDLNKIVSASTQRDERIDDLYNDGAKLAEAVKQQADQIKRLDVLVSRLSQAVLVIASRPKLAARLGGVLYWVGAGLAMLLLVTAAWLFYSVFKSHTREAIAWAVPAIVIVVGLAFWLAGQACYYVLASPHAPGVED